MGLNAVAVGWREAHRGVVSQDPVEEDCLWTPDGALPALFPMFAILALWGGRPRVNNAIVALSLPLLGLFTVLFADWYWVA